MKRFFTALANRQCNADIVNYQKPKDFWLCSLLRLLTASEKVEVL